MSDSTDHDNTVAEAWSLSAPVLSGRMPEPQGVFESFRGLLRIVIGLLLLAAAIGSAIYIVARLVN